MGAAEASSSSRSDVESMVSLDTGSLRKSEASVSGAPSKLAASALDQNNKTLGTDPNDKHGLEHEAVPALYQSSDCRKMAAKHGG